ncbi:MAG: hypothetical protein WBG30_02720 [Psychrilyobacter sp.]|uniref:hypothetical protein n=1 Tax=Psychrilyobacter sp. TaxID=2586924 RepID=UPI003C71AB60
MFVKNRSDPLIHIKQILSRDDISKVEKIILTRIMLEPYDEFIFSIKNYSEDVKISISGIKKSLIHLEKLGILARAIKIGGRYRYTLKCNKF